MESPTTEGPSALAAEAGELRAQVGGIGPERVLGGGLAAHSLARFAERAQPPLRCALLTRLPFLEVAGRARCHDLLEEIDRVELLLQWGGHRGLLFLQHGTPVGAVVSWEGDLVVGSGADWSLRVSSSGDLRWRGAGRSGRVRFWAVEDGRLRVHLDGSDLPVEVGGRAREAFQGLSGGAAFVEPVGVPADRALAGVLAGLRSAAVAALLADVSLTVAA